MKNYKNKLFAVLFSVFALVSFTSCEDDDYIVRTGLYCQFLSTSDSRGYFASEGGGDYTFNNIPDIGRNPDIREFIYNGTVISITGDIQPGDVIRDLYIDVEGLGEFRYAKTIPVRYRNELIEYDTYDDPEFYDFMSDAMYHFYRNGWINILVSGYITDRSGTAIRNVRMDIVLDNSLDIRIRD